MECALDFFLLFVVLVLSWYSQSLYLLFTFEIHSNLLKMAVYVKRYHLYLRSLRFLFLPNSQKIFLLLHKIGTLAMMHFAYIQELSFWDQNVFENIKQKLKRLTSNTLANTCSAFNENLFKSQISWQLKSKYRWRNNVMNIQNFLNKSPKVKKKCYLPSSVTSWENTSKIGAEINATQNIG